MTYIDYPTEFHSKSVVDQVIQKLTNVKNSRVDQVLGKYYLKHEKVGIVIIIIKKQINSSYLFS